MQKSLPAGYIPSPWFRAGAMIPHLGLQFIGLTGHFATNSMKVRHIFVVLKQIRHFEGQSAD